MAGKSGPAAAGVKFAFSVEQRLAAADAAINARLMVVPIFAGEGSLRSFLPCDVILFGRELLTPLVVGFFNAAFGFVGLGHDLFFVWWSSSKMRCASSLTLRASVQNPHNSRARSIQGQTSLNYFLLASANRAKAERRPMDRIATSAAICERRGRELPCSH